MSSMRGSEKPKRYSAVRYWRYIFTPLLLFIVVFGLYLLFTMSDANTASYDSILKHTSLSLLSPTSPATQLRVGMEGLSLGSFGSNILRGMQGLRLTG